MVPSNPVEIRALTASDLTLMADMMTMFGEAFDEMDTYTDARPDPAYHRRLLRDPHVIALAALGAGRVVGGLTAYQLPKFERRRSEIYVYDLAVAARYRRQGIATRLIRALQAVAARRGAHVIFIQADITDAPAIALYQSLGAGEQVLHFDIPVEDED